MEAHIISYSICPACGATAITKVMSAVDYLVSGKAFDIYECGECSLRFTQDGPDAQSVDQYYKSSDYISHSSTKKGLINRLYHLVRNITLQDKRRLILTVTQKQKGKLLDIGAGTGAFMSHMRSSGWEVTGREPDAQARANANELYKLNLLPPDGFYQIEPDTYDVITLWHVLEHVHDLHGYLEQLRKILKPHGKILIAVPNYTSFDASFYKGFWAAYDVPRHLYHFSPESMFQLMNKHDLQLYTMRGMFFDSFYISMLSEKYKKGTLLRALMIALISNIKAFVNKEKCSSVIYIVGK